MTCIAAIVDKKGVGHIACDSVASNYATKSVYVTPKIFTVGDMLFGFTDSYRMGQILQHQLDLPPAAMGQSFESWLHVDFVEAVRQVLKSNGYLYVEHNEETAGNFLIVVSGRIFTMQEDMSLLESQDCFQSVGSGEDYARATMNALLNHGVTNPQRILTEAIEAAIKYVPSVGGEIHMLSEDTA